MMNPKTCFAALVLLIATPWLLSAHDGRRFEIEVLNDNALWAQGSIGGGVDDGGGIHRPYYNAIHDHWSNAPGGKQEAIATLPAWDIFNPDPRLVGHSISLELVDVFRWVAPPLMPPAGTVPDFEPIDMSDLIQISTLQDSLTVTAGGSFGTIELLDSVDIHGHFDLPFEYKINKKPENEIYIFEWVMSTSAPGINRSHSIFAVLSPDGLTMSDRLHHASLYTEQYLGIRTIPEPGSLAFLALLGGYLAVQRRRKAL